MPVPGLDADLLQQALAALGRRLAERRLTGEIVVYGGGAMLLQFEVERRTRDLDVRVLEGHGPIFAAAREVERDLALPPGWLSEAVTQYTSRLEGPTARHWHAEYPADATGYGLRVHVARPEYLLAMKLLAARTGSFDLADAAVLARACRLTNAAGLQAAIARWFPDQPLAEHVRDAVTILGAELARTPPA